MLNSWTHDLLCVWNIIVSANREVCYILYESILTNIFYQKYMKKLSKVYEQ